MDAIFNQICFCCSFFLPGNSLSQLIGHYNTDSEEENDEDETIINENTTIGNDKIISTGKIRSALL